MHFIVLVAFAVVSVAAASHIPEAPDQQPIGAPWTIDVGSRSTNQRHSKGTNANGNICSAQNSLYDARSFPLGASISQRKDCYGLHNPYPLHHAESRCSYIPSPASQGYLQHLDKYILSQSRRYYERNKVCRCCTVIGEFVEQVDSSQIAKLGTRQCVYMSSRKGARYSRRLPDAAKLHKSSAEKYNTSVSSMQVAIPTPDRYLPLYAYIFAQRVVGLSH
ncbi:hypothetical protein CERZMDRAFT_86624 [Cercospora zeae-maydis SCOH1-5]|uniref:Uncharacterized protein n=1 Tax=Cercospora zeae-maydis SCOH1-5 TaxID=717836 RepID=A0A6A6F9D6_9PEZI|nr:hypothetical protein CERZMDRAFT_86624 [Cercospora zeae-maydis SCOH1-5]